MDYNSEKIYTVSLTEREWMLITNTLWLDHNFELSEKIEKIIEKEKKKMTGIVKWFNNQKGYGFITDSEGKDIFVHYSAIQMDGFKTIIEGDVVEYEIGEVTTGREQAVNVKPIITRIFLISTLYIENIITKRRI